MKNINAITTAVFLNNSKTAMAATVWQYDYGMKLRLQGLHLPAAVEVHFSAQETRGEAITRVGTTQDGVTDVTIPDSLLENDDATRNYLVYAFVYLTDETSGQTEYKVTIPVNSRPRPAGRNKPEEAELFRQAIDAVNTAADRAEAAGTTAQSWATGGTDTRDGEDTDNAKYYAQQAQKAVDDAAEAFKGSAEQIEENAAGIKTLKEDLVTHLGEQQKSSNLINVDSPECVAGYYNSVTGIYTSETHGFTSNFIDFDIDATHRYTYPTSWFSQDVTLWDEQKQLIVSKKSLSNFRTVSDGVAILKIDKNVSAYDPLFASAKYIRFSAYKADSDFSEMMAVKDIPYPSKFVPYFDKYVYSNYLKTYIENQIQNGIAKSNPLYAKTVLFTGDSICAGFIDNGDGTYGKQYGWAEIIKENNPSITMKNYGAGGTTIATLDTTTNSILQRLDTMHTEYPEADWIVLEGGVNDCYSSKIELGDVTQDYSSPLDVTTFCGALESLFKKSIEYWSGKKICFIVTFKVPTAVGFKNYMDKAKEICEKWSIPYIDLYSKSGLEFNVKYMKDNYSYNQGGLHPNIEGYEIITPKIEAWMKSL